MTKNEEVIDNIINSMIPYLDYEQIHHLKDTLYIQFHGLQITEECTDLVPTGNTGDDYKIKMFLASKRAINRSNLTLKQYNREIRDFLAFIGKPTENVTAMDIRYYFSVLQEKRHCSTNTVQSYKRFLNSYFQFLLDEGVITSNPVKKVGNIKTEKLIKKAFSSEEMEKLRNSCLNNRDRAIIEFLYSTGVRVSELCSLNISDINFSTKEVIVLGKGSKERKTYITESAMYYLKEYLQTRMTEQDFVNRPLFVGLRVPHNRLRINSIEEMLTHLGEKAGVSDVHPHRFRRTIATDLLSRGMPLEQVKDFLGHERVDTTMIYCTVSEEQVRTSHKKYA